MSINERIEPYELAHIGTGKRVTPPYMADGHYGPHAVLREGLKKDGTPSMGTMAGRLSIYDPTNESRSRWINLNQYVRYDAAQEALADPIRAEIARLRLTLEGAEARLLDVYKEPR